MTHDTAIDLLDAASPFDVFRLTIGYDEVTSGNPVSTYTTVRSVGMLPEAEQARFEALVARAVGSEDGWSWDIYAPVPAEVGAEVQVFIDGDLFLGKIVEVVCTPKHMRTTDAPKGEWVVRVDVNIPGKVEG